MISEVEFNNFRLFKTESVLSYKADKRTQYLLSNAIDVDNISILKALALYGSNNSGKTNIVALFQVIKAILDCNTNFICNRKLFKDEALTDISITFNNLDGLGWLKYEVTYDSEYKLFPFEKLSVIKYYKTGSQSFKTIFERKQSENMLSVFDEDFSQFFDILPFDKPFLSTIDVNGTTFSKLKCWKDALKKCSDSIEIINMFNIPLQNTIESLKGANEQKQRFIKSFVKASDISINDFVYDKSVKIDLSNGDNKVNEKALFDMSGFIDAFKLTTNYSGTIVPSLLFDSSGTKKVEAIASYIYDSLIEGKLLVIDELDNGLHYSLTRAIVSLFNNMLNTRGQLLFTAHDLLLIDCKNLLRKEQIYFVTRSNETSKLDTLKSFKANKEHLREGDSLIKRYNHGDFGKVPSPQFVKELEFFSNAANVKKAKDF